MMVIESEMVLSYQREGNLAICNVVDRTQGKMLSEVSHSGKRMTVWCHSQVELKKQREGETNKIKTDAGNTDS